jgi:hypothetical protein
MRLADPSFTFPLLKSELYLGQRTLQVTPVSVGRDSPSVEIIHDER